MTVGKDMDVTIKSKGAGGQGKVAASVIAPSGKPVASKVTEHVYEPRPETHSVEVMEDELV